MSNANMKSYVAAAEIVASVAVVASLVFVVISLNQNTAAIQSANDNFLYQLEDARMADITGSSEMADLLFRVSRGEVLSEAERFRYEYWVLRQVNFWELAFTRHEEGMMPPSQWISWDASFRSTVIARLPRETWNRSNAWYGQAFRTHVDAAYAEQQ